MELFKPDQYNTALAGNALLAEISERMLIATMVKGGDRRLLVVLQQKEKICQNYILKRKAVTFIRKHSSSVTFIYT